MIKKVALVGNPNVGKSTIFNLLTGLNQKVGNYPGVTVDKKYGSFQLDNKSIEIVDLPGTYSINPKTEDEQVVHGNVPAWRREQAFVLDKPFNVVFW